MSKHNKKLADYAGMTLDEALRWVEDNCQYEKDCRRLRSRMVGHLLATEIKRLRAEAGKPVHAHDCKDCDFLGSIIDSGELFDIYSCKETDTKHDLIVARFSSKPSGCITTTNRNSQNPAINFGWYLYNQKQKV